MSERTPSSDPISIFRSFAGSFALGLLLAALGSVSAAKSHSEVLDATVSKAKASLQACDKKAKTEAKERKIAASLATLWQARATIYQSADEIRAKNFGRAEQLLQDAARLVRAACAETACDAEDLAQGMTIHRFALTAPVEDSLTEVSAFGSAIDRLLGV